MGNTHFLLRCLFLPTIYTTVVVQVHRSAVYKPSESCAFLRNISWSADETIQSCVWECVYEKDCQTAVYFSNPKLCSLFAESCKVENIQPSGGIQANVICYRKNQASTVTCSSTAATNHPSTSSTNLKVLLLSDTNTAAFQPLVDHLQSTGLIVNYISGGITTYSGTPSAASYQSIILISGNLFLTDMPIAGQEAIVNAQQNNGIGIVMTEAAASHVLVNQWSILRSLLLAHFVGYTTEVISYSLINSGHPIWNNLSNPFSTSGSIYYAKLGAPYNNSTVIADCATSGTPGVIVRPSMGTSGPIVHINHAAHSNGFNWGTDQNLLSMMINSVRWAANLI